MDNMKTITISTQKQNKTKIIIRHFINQLRSRYKNKQARIDYKVLLSL